MKKKGVIIKILSNRWDRRCRIQNICITSKAALITLFSLQFLHTLYGLVINPIIYILQKTWLSYFPLLYAVNAATFLFYPLAGYFADNVIGRYQTITRSLEVFIISISMAVLLLLFTICPLTKLLTLSLLG